MDSYRGCLFHRAGLASDTVLRWCDRKFGLYSRVSVSRFVDVGGETRTPAVMDMMCLSFFNREGQNFGTSSQDGRAMARPS